MTARFFDRKNGTGKPVLSKYGTYLRNTALVCIAYFAAGRVGLAAPFTSGNVSPVWPASGIALSAVLLLGWRIWPGIALGAFLTNLLSPIPHIAAAGLALGNTLAALTGAFLLRRMRGFRPSLSRLMDILQLVTLGALTSPTVSASIGVATLFATHLQPWKVVPLAWLIYWLGDAMVVLLITPLVLTLSSIVRMRRGRIMELITLIVTLVFACLTVFNDRILGEVKHDVLAFGVFPFIIWAAIRLGMVGSSMAVLVIATIATSETALGSGPFAQGSPFQNSALLQVYLAVLAISGLSLAAVIAEREQAEAERTQSIRDQANQAEVLRDLSGRLLQMQDEERRRLARELHDSVGQMVIAMDFNLGVIGKSQNLSPEAARALKENATLGAQLSQEIRTLSHLLHPPLLDEVGLESALQWYVSGFTERSKIEVDLDIPPDLPRLAREMEISIFRLVQESLTNIYRHSGSRTAAVSLVHEGGMLSLYSEDFGKGMGLEESRPFQAQTGVGIRGMRERVRQFGGSLQIESNRTGTRVIARFPAAGDH